MGKIQSVIPHGLCVKVVPYDMEYKHKTKKFNLVY